MSKGLKIVVAILIIGIIGAGVVYKMLYTQVKTIESYKVDISIDEGAMVDEFTNDAQNAHEKYVERVIEVNGIVHKIEKTDSSLTIIFDNGKDYIISLQVNERNIEKGSKLKIGDLTALVGQYNGYLEGDKTFMLPGTIQLSRCYFK